MMMLKALSSIAVEQMKTSDKMMVRCTQLLDYLLHNADAKVHVHASDMIFNIHLMHLTCWNHRLEAVLVNIFSWDGCLKIGNPFVSTTHSTSAQQS
jgi:hypothetical protein